MSLPDSDSSSNSRGYRNFKQITRHRLLQEMIHSCGSTSPWKVLVMDKLTVKIMSRTCTASDTANEGVSLLERIDFHRQPFPCMDAIYFIQPTRENVIKVLSDMRKPLYRRAYIFFSSTISEDLVTLIKKDKSVFNCISALREMNLEYLPIDSQGFVTNNEEAIEHLYGDKEDSRNGVACLNNMAARVATVFASLREFPYVRYRTAKSLDPTVMTTFPDLIPTKLAAGIWDCLLKYKKTIPDFPETETCELLILDRSVDQIAPVIHEWTYDAMCHDLLDIEENKYVLEVPSKTGGPPEKKIVHLDDSDPVWLELRYEHIGCVIQLLGEKTKNFVVKNPAAQIEYARSRPQQMDLGSRELSTKDFLTTVQALPQYTEQKDRLALHAEIASKILGIISDLGLAELAELEQNIVFGDADWKDVIKYLSRKEVTNGENKLRLLMILAAVCPEKFKDFCSRQRLMHAKLTPADWNAVNNLGLLGGSISDNPKTSTGFFSLNFDIYKKKRAARRERPNQDEFRFSRFYSLIEELVEKLSRGELSKEEYPCLNHPRPTLAQTPAARSVRSTWARSQNSEFGCSRHASSDFKKIGQRIFVVIAGGATRSELRVCHKLSEKLGREVVLGASSLEDPASFIRKLKKIGGYSDST